MTTGEATQYTEAESQALAAAFAQAMQSPGNTVRITGKFEWSGETRERIRTITFTGVNLADARKAAQSAGGTYRAKSWQAQLRRLERTQRGRELLRTEGLTASAGTRRRWASGAQAPSASNRQAISRAFQGRRGEVSGRAMHRVTRVVTGAIERSTGGQTVRIKDIRDINIR
jgi:hypothetical protein